LINEKLCLNCDYDAWLKSWWLSKNLISPLYAASTAASTSAQNFEVGAAGDFLSQHQARLRAASLAASIYGKSFIYPSTNTLFGYASFIF